MTIASTSAVPEAVQATPAARPVRWSPVNPARLDYCHERLSQWWRAVRGRRALTTESAATRPRPHPEVTASIT